MVVRSCRVGGEERGKRDQRDRRLWRLLSLRAMGLAMAMEAMKRMAEKCMMLNCVPDTLDGMNVIL